MQKFLFVVTTCSVLLLSACGGSSSNPSPQPVTDGGGGNGNGNGNGGGTGDGDSGSNPASQELLVSRRGGHYWHDYCEGKPDSTAVPADPRGKPVKTIISPQIAANFASVESMVWPWLLQKADPVRRVSLLVMPVSPVTLSPQMPMQRCGSLFGA